MKSKALVLCMSLAFGACGSSASSPPVADPTPTVPIEAKKEPAERKTAASIVKMCDTYANWLEEEEPDDERSADLKATCTEMLTSLSDADRLAIEQCAGSCGDADSAVECYDTFGTDSFPGTACGEEDEGDEGGE